MSRRTVQNFRGMRATILLGLDRNRTVLIENLSKLGLKVQAADPLDGTGAVGAALQKADLVFFDADLAEAVAACLSGDAVRVPVVAIIGLALQLIFLKASESMGNHDSEIVDAGSVD